MSIKLPVKLFKAVSSAERPTPDLLIEASEPFPVAQRDSPNDPERALALLHQSNAQVLLHALLTSLPGGTIDRLLLALLEHRASLLVVPYPRRPLSPTTERPAPRYFLEIVEDDHRIPTGPSEGFATLAEAKAAARRSTDDALPHNTVRIFALLATASLGGDGEPYVTDHTT